MHCAGKVCYRFTRKKNQKFKSKDTTQQLPRHKIWRMFYLTSIQPGVPFKRPFTPGCFSSLFFNSEPWRSVPPGVSNFPPSPSLPPEVFVSSSAKYSELGQPFGYLKASTSLTCVNLYVMPYNYPVLLPLLGKHCPARPPARIVGRSSCLSIFVRAVCLPAVFLNGMGTKCCKLLRWEKRLFTPPLPFFLCSRGGEPPAASACLMLLTS